MRFETKKQREPRVKVTPQIYLLAVVTSYYGRVSTDPSKKLAEPMM